MGTDIYLIRNGKFRARWGNGEAMGMMQQLGYLPDERPVFSPPDKGGDWSGADGMKIPEAGLK